MATQLSENEWGLILQHDGHLLELRWLPSTATMTDGGFMATLCLFASEAEKARARRLLIDATRFQHRLGDGVMACGTPTSSRAMAPRGYASSPSSCCRDSRTPGRKRSMVQPSSPRSGS